MKTALPGSNDLPQQLPIISTYHRITAAFPGGPAPVQVVVSAPDIHAPGTSAALRALSEQAVATGEMSAALQTRVNAAGTVAVISIPQPATAPTGHPTMRCTRCAAG